MARSRKITQWKIAQSAEIKWWQQYLRGKSITDYKTDKIQYWNTLLTGIQQHLPQLENQRVLDAGCGPSGIFMALDKSRIHAIDPLLESYQSTLDHFDKSDYPWVQFFQSSIEQFVIEEAYDVIFCMNAINHVADIKQCYKKLFDALNPGGILILTTDAHAIPNLKYVFQWLPGDILHPHQYDALEYQKFLVNQGFEVIHQNSVKDGFLFNHLLQIAKKPKYD
jgi:2-polyprenyl-3-methyl-5-hydroxy-6-metoxy-1,4-benzoquinol methylase